MTLNRIRLGRTGYMVSRIGFGALPVQRLDPAEAVEVLRGAIRRGINFIDSANMYTDSEEKIGQALNGLPNNDDLVLATKTLARDAETAFSHVETSLKRLGKKFIHLYQLHAVNDFAHLEEVSAPGGALEGLKKAREKGYIENIGITGHRSDVLVKAIKTGAFATVQAPYNFIETEPAKELFPLARDLDVGIIVMKPLGGGMITEASISIKYILQQESAVPIPGFETIAEVEEVLEAARGPYQLRPEELLAVESIKNELGKRFCRRCNYCAPCPQGIHIPQAMILNTLLKRLGLKHFIFSWGKEALEKAETCVECGDCETRCPYNLPVREIIAGHVRQINGLLAEKGMDL